MTGETDRYHVERCLDGHRNDFRHLVLRYQKPLLAGIRCRQVRLDVAEDVAQEAFVRAFANLAALRKPDSFFCWLLGIAYRVLLERAGRERWERAGLARLEAETRATDARAGPWSGDAALEAALAALPDHCREVILLRFYGDCSCSEVAERLGIPLGTVTKRLSRGGPTRNCGRVLRRESRDRKAHVLPCAPRTPDRTPRIDVIARGDPSRPRTSRQVRCVPR